MSVPSAIVGGHQAVEVEIVGGEAAGLTGGDLAALHARGPAGLVGPLRDGFRLWLAGSEFSPATQTTYYKRARLYLRWLVEHGQHPDALTDGPARDRAVSEYLAELMAVAPNDSTHNVSLAAIRAFYESIKMGPVLVDPAMVIPGVPKTLTEQQQSVLLDEAAASGPRDYALIALTLDVGPRVSELRRLDIDDADLSSRAGSVRLTAPDGQSRDVPLSQATTWVLMGWRAVRASTLGRQSRERALLVSRSRRARMSETGIEYVVATLGRAAGLEISPSTLRNTVEQRLLLSGCSLAEVAARMGQNYTSMPRVRALRSAMHESRSNVRRSAPPTAQLSFDFP